MKNTKVVKKIYEGWPELVLTFKLEAETDDKESTCNAGDLGSIPGSGRSLEKGKATHFSFLRLPQVAQTVKNPPAVWETWVWSLGWEDPLEKQKATHSSILAWRIPWTEDPGGLKSMVSQKNWTQLSNFHLRNKDDLFGSPEKQIEETL